MRVLKLYIGGLTRSGGLRVAHAQNMLEVQGLLPQPEA